MQMLREQSRLNAKTMIQLRVNEKYERGSSVINVELCLPIVYTLS